jgi:hypothetical protein
MANLNEQTLALVRERLTDDAIAAEWEAGSAFSLPELVAFALTRDELTRRTARRRSSVP